MRSVVRGLPGLCVAVVLAGVLAAARPGLRFTSMSRVAEIPFDLHNNHITFRGRLNDSDSLWFLLDTGAHGIAMNASRARALGYDVRSRGQALGAGGSVDAGVVSAVTVRMPGVELGEDIGTIPLDQASIQSGRDMDVIVGSPLLERSVVEVDYARRLVRVHDPRRFDYKGKGAILPITFHEGLPYVSARTELPGRAPLEGRFVIDTGAATALALSPPFVESNHVLQSVPRTIRARFGGVGGPVESPVGRIDRLRLGGVVLERPVTVFRTADATGRISAEGTAGNIGGEILRRFHVFFDYPHRRMILEPSAQLGEPFETDMSGIALSVVDSTRAIRVLWTQADSPAVEVGIAAGDVLEQVDGVDVGEIGISALRRMFRSPDVMYRLTLRRGDEPREVTLKTRRLI